MCFFFFSSRRRHTRYIGDWSSDVCSSDLDGDGDADRQEVHRNAAAHRSGTEDADPVDRDQRSEERRVGKSVDLGGRRIIKKKKTKNRDKKKTTITSKKDHSNKQSTVE